MTNESGAATSSETNWQPKHVYAMASICLVVGLALGYLFRGSQAPSPARSAATQPGSGPEAHAGGSMPTLDQMKHMAEKKAEPVLAKLKADPNNAALLVQAADIYKQTHQFKEAVGYYRKSLEIDPKNAGVRSDLASVLYYSGDVDGALTEVQEALKHDPKNGAALFNLGMIRWQGKKDGPGAISAWDELLKTNPSLSADRKAAVQKLIAQAKEGQ